MKTNVQDMMREALRPPTLDACAPKKNTPKQNTFNDAGYDASDDYTESDIALKAANALAQWTETDDLEDGESIADRLTAMFIGIADANQDGEIDDDEQGVIDIALNAAWDYLSRHGVDDADISALLEDWDADAGQRVRDYLASSLPNGDDADADIDDFVFGDDDQDAAFDATYKKKVAFRHGQKVKINKRVSGTVHLSAKQKLAIRKMLMKSHSAGAQMRRKKTVTIRHKRGM